MTPASDYTMAPATNAGGHSTKPGHVGGFEELLVALNPYMDDILHRPMFHLFMGLPVVRISPRALSDVHTLTLVYR
jgi:hypothetical protein